MNQVMFAFELTSNSKNWTNCQLKSNGLSCSHPNRKWMKAKSNERPKNDCYLLQVDGLTLCLFAILDVGFLEHYKITK